MMRGHGKQTDDLELVVVELLEVGGGDAVGVVRLVLVVHVAEVAELEREQPDAARDGEQARRVHERALHALALADAQRVLGPERPERAPTEAQPVQLPPYRRQQARC